MEAEESPTSEIRITTRQDKHLSLQVETISQVSAYD